MSLPSIQAGTIVRFHTTVGAFDVELFDADKPVTVQNFLRYAQGGLYTNMFMHRVVTNFVIQGGGFYVAQRGTPNAYHTNITTFNPITNEIDVGPFYSNGYGTIAMAKSSDPNSATSQFFFNLADNSATLDDRSNSGGFTVFGRVIAGTNVLNLFKVGPTNKVVKSSNQGDVFSQLPVLFSARNASITFDDLLYVETIVSPTTPLESFTPSKSAYNGLVTVSNSAAAPGFITLATTSNGKFSGTLRLGSARYSLTGSLDAYGEATVTPRSGLSSPVTVRLRVDSAADRLVGTVSNVSFIADLAAERSSFDIRTNPAVALAGKYTLILPASDQLGAPAGDGFAAISVDLGGKVKVTGSLADGTAFTQTLPVAKDGRWPLFVPLYTSKGSLSGWMTFTNRPEDNLNGTVRWQKPPLPTAKLFPAGFDTQIAASGAHYTQPAAGATVLPPTVYVVSFTGGNLASFANTITLTPANKVVNGSSNSLTMTITLTTGLFTGNVKPPGLPKGVAFKGALRQDQNSGYGYFLGTDQSGRVVIAEAASQ